MKEGNKPLMFIDTFSDVGPQKREQSAFDSRKQLNKLLLKPTAEEQQEIKHVPAHPHIDIEERKLQNILEMYQKDRPVLCSVVLEKEEIVGIPYRRDDTFLYVSVSEHNDNLILLKDIKKINIIKF